MIADKLHLRVLAGRRVFCTAYFNPPCGRVILRSMNQLTWLIPSVLSVVALGGVGVQQRRIATLEARIAAPHDNADDVSAELLTLSARVAQVERASASASAMRVVAAPAPAEVPAAPGAAPAAPATLVAEVRQLREDVNALLTGEATATEQGQARLRSLIADTQQNQWREREVRRDERVLQQLTQDAHLSPSQHDDVAKALEAERTQRQTLMANARAGQGRPEDLRTAMQALREQTNQRVRSLLSAEQYPKYEATRTFGRGPRGGGPGGPGGGGPAANP